jgi:hypothetical protein
MLFNKFNFIINKFCDNNPNKPELSGVFINSKEESVATDSFKMIKVNTENVDEKEYPLINNQKPAKDFKSFILPKEQANDVAKLFKKENKNLPILNNAIILKETEDIVEIGKADNELQGFNKIMARKIQGEYPKYQELYKEKEKYTEIKINPKILKEIIDFYSQFCDTPTPQLKIKISKKETDPIKFIAERQSGQKAEALLMPIIEK